MSAEAHRTSVTQISGGLAATVREKQGYQGWIWGLLVVVAGAEWLITYESPWVGIGVHAIVILGVLLALSRTTQSLTHRFGLTLLLIPLIRLLSLGLPLQEFPQITWYAAVAIPLFVAMAQVARLSHWSVRDIGWQWGRWWQEGAFALVGIVLGITEYVILRPAPLTETLSLQALWFPAVILFLGTGLLEELLFRGFLQGSAIPVMGKTSAIWYSALMFAVMHIGYQSLVDFLFVLAVGLLFSVWVRYTNSLVGVTLAHGLTNIMLFLVLPHLWAEGVEGGLVMISTVTTTVTTLVLGGSFALLCIATLLVLLVQREMISVLQGERWARMRTGLRVVIIPLWLVFLTVGVLKLAAVLM